MIYADFGNISVPEKNRKQNPEEIYKEKYKKNMLLAVMAITQHVLIVRLVMKILKTLLNVESIIILILMVISK